MLKKNNKQITNETNMNELMVQELVSKLMANEGILKLLKDEDIVYALQNYENLKNSAIVLPAFDDANDGQVDWDDIYSRWGAVDNSFIENFDFDDLIEEVERKYLKSFSISSKLNPDQVKRLNEAYVEFKKSNDDLRVANQEMLQVELANQWGSNYERNTQLAQRGAKAIGIELDVLSALDNLGASPIALLNVLKSIGENIHTSLDLGSGGALNSAISNEEMIDSFSQANANILVNPAHPEYKRKTAELSRLLANKNQFTK